MIIMTKTTTRELGIASIIPLIYLISWAIIAYLVLRLNTSPVDIKFDLFELFYEFIEGAFHFVVLLYMLVISTIIIVLSLTPLIIFLIIYYIDYIVKHQKGITKVAWIAALVCFNIFCFPVFWYFNIRSEYLPQKQSQLPI